METWIDRLAVALDLEPLAPSEVDALLTAAREVAHGVERRVTPLTAFLAGVAVGRNRGQEPREVAVTRTLEIVRRQVEEQAPRPDA
jgi:hypothetical protein